MATKDKKPAVKKATSPTKITRITARDDKNVDKSTAKKPAATTKKAATATKKPTVAAAISPSAKKPTTKKLTTRGHSNPFSALFGYFKGAWYELKQVSWPNRKATWSLTAALIAFTTFFVVIILLLDSLFKYLFELILG